MPKARKPPAYTATGDRGETGLIGGRRVRKSSLRVSVYGDVDELNSTLGVASQFMKSRRVNEIVRQVQRDLFILGTELASPGQKIDSSAMILPQTSQAMLSYVERETNKLHDELPLLRNFILPGGSPGASLLQLARAVARRAERGAVALSETEAVRDVILKYLNRLSSLLFELARFENRVEGRKEEVWSSKTAR